MLYFSYERCWKILLVLRKLDLGGIQSLFVKVANTLAAAGEPVAILSLESRVYADENLLQDLNTSVNVFFIEDQLASKILPKKLLLWQTVTKEFGETLKSYGHIHVTDIYSLLFLGKVGLNSKQTISLGLYHPNEVLHRFTYKWLHSRIDLKVFLKVKKLFLVKKLRNLKKNLENIVDLNILWEYRMD